MVGAMVIEVWADRYEIEGCARYDVTVGKLAGSVVAHTGDWGLSPCERLGDCV